MDEVGALSGSYWAGKLETLVLVMVQALVDDHRSVQVLASFEEGKCGTVTVTVAQKDLGKVIGKQGRMARALRTIVAAAGQKHGQRFAMDIVGAANG